MVEDQEKKLDGVQKIRYTMCNRLHIDRKEGIEHGNDS